MDEQDTLCFNHDGPVEHSQVKTSRYFRKLGALETLAQNYHSRGLDITSQLFHVVSNKLVTPCDLKTALDCLRKRHPLLRACIAKVVENGIPTFHFKEMKRPNVDFSIIDRGDWENVIDEEISQQFDVEEGPLWRCRLLRNRGSSIPINGIYKHSTVIAMTWHHSIFDGIYLQTVFADLTMFLDEVQCKRRCGAETEELPVHMPIERMLLKTLGIGASGGKKPIAQLQRAISITGQLKPNSRLALEAYTETHACEIAQLSLNEPVPKTIQLELSQAQTEKFVQLCKHHGVSVTGAIVAACCLSFQDILGKRESDHDNDITIPFEFLANIRPYLSLFGNTDGSTYAGLAAIHVPSSLTVCSSMEKPNENVLWQHADTSTRGIRETVQSDTPMKVVENTINEQLNGFSTISKGKSQYVLCISNVGKTNNFIGEEQQESFKVHDMMGATSILNDDMPIFMVVFITLNGRLKGYVSYCGNFTSFETASRFTDNLHDYLNRQKISRL